MMAGLLLPIFFSWGCMSKTTPFQKSDRIEITDLLRKQQEAWNAGDIHTFMEGYWKDDLLVFTSGSTIRRGWQETLARYQKRYGDDRSTMGELFFEILDLKTLGRDGAVVLGRWRLEGLPEPAGGVFSIALERRPEGWRIVHDHTSSDPG